MAPACEAAFVFKQLKMEGFLVSRWTSRWMEGLSQMTKWIQEVYILNFLLVKQITQSLIWLTGENQSTGDVHRRIRKYAASLY